MAATRVYSLEHVHALPHGEEDVKRLGIFSSRTRAEDALARARSLPGFRDGPEGFEIHEIELDRMDWTEGFVTV